MSEQAFFILAALVDVPRHGYGIANQVADLSDGRIQLRVGTLYGALDRLVGDDVVELDRDEVHQGRLRRYYRLTDTGREALAAEAQRQAGNAKTVTRLLGAHRPAHLEGGT